MLWLVTRTQLGPHVCRFKDGLLRHEGPSEGPPDLPADQGVSQKHYG